MASRFDIIGWEEFDGHRHPGRPDDHSNLSGLIVSYENDVTGDTDTFMHYIPRGKVLKDDFDWQDIYDDIEAAIEMYARASAGGGGGPGPGDDSEGGDFDYPEPPREPGVFKQLGNFFRGLFGRSH